MLSSEHSETIKTAIKKLWEQGFSEADIYTTYEPLEQKDLKDEKMHKDPKSNPVFNSHLKTYKKKMSELVQQKLSSSNDSKAATKPASVIVNKLTKFFVNIREIFIYENRNYKDGDIELFVKDSVQLCKTNPTSKQLSAATAVVAPVDSKQTASKSILPHEPQIIPKALADKIYQEHCSLSLAKTPLAIDGARSKIGALLNETYTDPKDNTLKRVGSDLQIKAMAELPSAPLLAIQPLADGVIPVTWWNNIPAATFVSKTKMIPTNIIQIRDAKTGAITTLAQHHKNTTANRKNSTFIGGEPDTAQYNAQISFLTHGKMVKTPYGETLSSEFSMHYQITDKPGDKKGIFSYVYVFKKAGDVYTFENESNPQPKTMYLVEGSMIHPGGNNTEGKIYTAENITPEMREQEKIARQNNPDAKKIEEEQFLVAVYSYSYEIPTEPLVNSNYRASTPAVNISARSSNPQPAPHGSTLQIRQSNNQPTAAPKLTQETTPPNLFVNLAFVNLPIKINDYEKEANILYNSAPEIRGGAAPQQTQLGSQPTAAPQLTQETTQTNPTAAAAPLDAIPLTSLDDLTAQVEAAAAAINASRNTVQPEIPTTTITPSAATTVSSPVITTSTTTKTLPAATTSNPPVKPIDLTATYKAKTIEVKMQSQHVSGKFTFESVRISTCNIVTLPPTLDSTSQALKEGPAIVKKILDEMTSDNSAKTPNSENLQLTTSTSRVVYDAKNTIEDTKEKTIVAPNKEPTIKIIEEYVEVIIKAKAEPVLQNELLYRSQPAAEVYKKFLGYTYSPDLSLALTLIREMYKRTKLISCITNIETLTNKECCNPEKFRGWFDRLVNAYKLEELTEILTSITITLTPTVVASPATSTAVAPLSTTVTPNMVEKNDQPATPVDFKTNLPSAATIIAGAGSSGPIDYKAAAATVACPAGDRKDEKSGLPLSTLLTKNNLQI